MIDLSIIIASYNTQGLLRDCIQSIFQTTSGITYEVIVVDDCSRDGSPEMVEREFPEVILLRNPQNMRYAKTNNRGLAAARGRYAVLLNSDTVIRPNAFRNMVRFMETHLDAAAAGPKLLNADGTIQHCIRGFPGLLPMLMQSLGLHRLLPGNRYTDQYYRTNFDYNASQVVDSIGTTAFIIRRSTWERFGMLDERFTLAFVDLAYCLLLKNANQKVYYVSDSEIVHLGSQTIRMNGLKEIKLLHIALRRFYDGYFAMHHLRPVRSLIRLAIWIREKLKLLEFRYSSNKVVFGGISLAGQSKS